MRSVRNVSAAARRVGGRLLHRAGVAIRADIRGLRSELAIASERLDAVSAAVEELAAHAHRLQRAQSELEPRVATSEHVLAIEAVSRFVRHAELQTQPLVSVVLPTYDRPERLGRAIESVLAQRYPRWELLVVDDGGSADSRAVIDSAGDPRIRWTRIEHGGASAARNAALRIAAGEIIAYLDDDNIMDPEWLYAVVWAFEHHPDAEVLYGAIVIDDILRVGGTRSGQLPRTFLHQWRRDALRHSNLADIGTIAHRAGLPEAHFDEGLREMGDWDLLLRLTAGRDPLVLPVVACYYRTDAPQRLSNGPTHRADLATVRARAGVASR